MLALVGESGCGKSTLALTLMGLEKLTEGRIVFEGNDITNVGEKQQKALRRRIQMVFQDPYEWLNPTQTIEEIVEEPLIVHKLERNSNLRLERVIKALEDSGLKPADLSTSIPSRTLRWTAPARGYCRSACPGTLSPSGR